MRLVVVGVLALALGRPLAASAAGSFPVGSIVDSVTTLDDSDQQYALYLPGEYSADSGATWPVLFVLDPRGRAVAGVERFLPAAERHGFIVLSSYQSRSDTWQSVTATALESLLRDAEVRFYTTAAYSLPSSFERIGEPARAARSLEVAIEIYPRRARAIWRLATLRAEMGDSKRAFEALRAAIALGNVDLERLKTDPTWDTLRPSPEWADVVAEVERAQAGG